MEKELYDEMAHELYEDIKANKLTYKDVVKRYDEIFKLIPFNVDVDYFSLDSLIHKKFEDDEDYKKEMEERRKKYSFLI